MENAGEEAGWEVFESSPLRDRGAPAVKEIDSKHEDIESSFASPAAAYEVFASRPSRESSVRECKKASLPEAPLDRYNRLRAEISELTKDLHALSLVL